jgi:ribosomal protein S11
MVYLLDLPGKAMAAAEGGGNIFRQKKDKK